MRLSGPGRRSSRDVSFLLAALALGAIALLSGCPDKKGKYPTCAGDKDCKDGEHCVNKHCQQCGDDSQCAPHEHCDNGGCALDPGKCNDNADCPTGVCKEHSCAPCESDAECGPDRRCAEGRCLARGACATDDDCADDEDCESGTCKRGGRDTPPDVACKLEAIFFAFDDARLDEAGKAVLAKNAECVQSVQGRGVMLIGHTDPRGTEEYNVALSESRAQSVGDYLARLGIDPARFRFVPKGESEAAGADESGWGQDRRVEFEWQ